MDFEKFYNEIEEYRAYREDENKNKEYEIWANWKVKHLSNIIPDNFKFSNVLEIGCAFGVVLNKFSKANHLTNIFGLDIAKVNTELGSKEFPHIHFITGTIENKDIISESGITENHFDLVLLCDIIEHIPDDLEFMKHVKSITKYAVIDLPLEKSTSTRKRNYGETDISGHLRSYDLKDGLDLIKNAGFKIISYKTEIVYHDKDCYHFNIIERDARISKKTIFKKLYWKTYYSIEDLSLKYFPKFYIKKNGCNLFAFISSIEKE